MPSSDHVKAYEVARRVEEPLHGQIRLYNEESAEAGRINLDMLKLISDLFLNDDNNTVLQYLIILGTFITAITALINIRLVKKQNRASYSPQLFPQNQYYVVRKSKEFVPFIVKQGEKEESYPEYAMHFAPYIIRNVGLGSALSVEVHWKFDHQRMGNYLCEIGKSRIKQDDTHKQQFYFMKQSGEDFGLIIKEPKEFKKNIASIIPGEEIISYIPESILNYISFRNELEILKRKRIQYIIDDIKLILNYLDIGSQSKQQVICMRILVNAYTLKNPTPGSDHALVRFEYYIPDKKILKKKKSAWIRK